MTTQWVVLPLVLPRASWGSLAIPGFPVLPTESSLVLQLACFLAGLVGLSGSTLVILGRLGSLELLPSLVA